MPSKIRLIGVFAWMILGLILGFVTYSVLSLYTISSFIIALFTGAFSASVTIVLYKEQESESDKFFVGLCALFVAGLASWAKYFNYYVPVMSIGTLIVGILVGILLSITMVAFLIKD